MDEYLAILEKVKTWVREVGQIQLEGLKQSLTVNWKSSEYDLVTNIDTQSERELIKRIKAEYPEHGILSEESGSTGEDSEFLWIIDPLDGTVNYAHGFPVFTISVALQYRAAVILGVVYAPVLQELYEAVKGHGAYLNGVRMQVAKVNELNKAILATGFPYDKASDRENNLNYFNHWSRKLTGCVGPEALLGIYVMWQQDG